MKKLDTITKIKEYMLTKSTSLSNGCIEWIGARNKGRYGTINIAGKSILVHRLSYYIYVGPFDVSLLVCHKCDNPSCINPEHLFLGTNKDNVDDMMNKKRHRTLRGEDHTNHKLTEEQVKEIFHSKLKLSEIASQYNIHKHLAFLIKKKQIWKHLNLNSDSSTNKKHRSKLTEQQAIEIINSPLSLKELASVYGICPQAVWKIKTGKTWKYLHSTISHP